MVGVVVVTHGNLAAELVRTAELILGPLDQVKAVGFLPHEPEEDMWSRLKAAVAAVDTGDGVLILVDMYGGTPSNLSLKLLERGRVEVVTGVSLPMLLKAGSSPRTNVRDYADKVRDSGLRNALVVSSFLDRRTT